MKKIMKVIETIFSVAVVVVWIAIIGVTVLTGIINYSTPSNYCTVEEVFELNNTRWCKFVCGGYDYYGILRFVRNCDLRVGRRFNHAVGGCGSWGDPRERWDSCMEWCDKYGCGMNEGIR